MVKDVYRRQVSGYQRPPLPEVKIIPKSEARLVLWENVKYSSLDGMPNSNPVV
jgi:hypothetical protein